MSFTKCTLFAQKFAAKFLKWTHEWERFRSKLTQWKRTIGLQLQTFDRWLQLRKTKQWSNRLMSPNAQHSSHQIPSNLCHQKPSISDNLYRNNHELRPVARSWFRESLKWRNFSRWMMTRQIFSNENAIGSSCKPDKWSNQLLSSDAKHLWQFIPEQSFAIMSYQQGLLVPWAFEMTQVFLVERVYVWAHIQTITIIQISQKPIAKTKGRVWEKKTNVQRFGSHATNGCPASRSCPAPNPEDDCRPPCRGKSDRRAPSLCRGASSGAQCGRSFPAEQITMTVFLNQREHLHAMPIAGGSQKPTLVEFQNQTYGKYQKLQASCCGNSDRCPPSLRRGRSLQAECSASPSISMKRIGTKIECFVSCCWQSEYSLYFRLLLGAGKDSAKALASNHSSIWFEIFVVAIGEGLCGGCFEREIMR